MTSEWKEYELEQIIDMLSKKVSAQHININNYISTENMIAEKGGITLSSGLPAQNNYLEFKKGDVLFSNIRTYFKKIWQATFSGGASNDIIVFRTKDKQILDQSFLYYLISNDNFIDFTITTAKGTKMPRGDRDAIKKFKFRIPVDVEEQKNIAIILNSLEQKINCNKNINKTLESISQTLFKSWFVDFDPVKAKIAAKVQGQDPQLAAMRAISGKTAEQIAQLPEDKRNELAATADLFPDDMVESELGMIPKGWKIGKIGEVYTSKGGYAFKSDEFIEEGFPVVKIKNITNSGYVDLSDTQKVSFESTTNKDSFVLRNGDVIMAMTGATIGKVGIIANHTNKKCFLNQRVAKFYPVNKPDNLNWFIYLFFRREENTIAILSMAQGSAQPNISTTGIDNVRAIIPDSKLLNRFNLIVDPLFKVWISNSIQSKKMSETRDILLPELLNGRLSNLE